MTCALEISSDPHAVVTHIELRGDFDRCAVCAVADALAAARVSGVKMIVVDLRHLTSIDAAALWSLRCAEAGCRASGVRLRLLIPARSGHEQLQRAFQAAGLGERVRFTGEPHLSALTTGSC